MGQTIKDLKLIQEKNKEHAFRRAFGSKVPFPNKTLSYFFQLYVNVTSYYGILGNVLSLNCTLIQPCNMQLLI